MGNRLYVSNLSFRTSEQDLRNEFAKCGSLTDVKIITDRETGRSRGFGFVQFATDGEANEAIKTFDGFTFDGRTLVVKVAEERKGGARPGGGGGRSFGGPPPSSPPRDFSRDSSGGGGGRKGGGKDRGKRRRDDYEY